MEEWLIISLAALGGCLRIVIVARESYFETDFSII